MENKIINKQDLTEKTFFLIKKNKNYVFLFLTLIVIILSAIFFIDYNNNKNHKKISEEFTKAGIYLQLEDYELSINIYKKIILSKNKFYSKLALNNIIDNDANTDADIAILFDKVLDIKYKKEEINLIKLKKALFFKKISRTKEGNKLLEEIITDESIWKDLAKEVYELNDDLVSSQWPEHKR
ncbi:hypothetical protein OAS21_01000 [Pelagibacteraceae bacterium]|jgi:hypothetical protein|nr:hypothetical protein [Pelagibacteraceae bacterium]